MSARRTKFGRQDHKSGADKKKARTPGTTTKGGPQRSHGAGPRSQQGGGGGGTRGPKGHSSGAGSTAARSGTQAPHGSRSTQGGESKNTIGARPGSTVEGTVSANRAGYGFLRVEGLKDSVFIPPGEMRGVMHGDRLRVRLSRDASERWAGVVERSFALSTDARG